jgi:hypothetical protein
MSSRITGSVFPLASVAAAMALALAAPSAARAADHRDSPRITSTLPTLGNLDILDVYVFQSPTNRNNTVLIMTAATDAGVLTPPFFAPGAFYDFKIENTGDTVEDLTLRFTFMPPDSTGRQVVVLTGIDGMGRSAQVAAGLTGRNVPIKGGGQFRADIFDDPFFFDLLAFNRFKARALAGDPKRANEFNARGNSNIPNNFFGGFNCIAIVLEVPSVRLQSSRANTKIGVWARTEVFGAQFDRMARPVINTVLIPDAFKDIFNDVTPSQDSLFIPIATAELTILFGTDMAYSQMIATMLLPDIFAFDTSSSKGFLNGRKPSDDVMDAILDLGSNGAVKTDNVSNDSVFRTRFPYLGTPNPKSPAP